MLDTEYVLPKIHAGYIGARIDLISSDPNAPKYAPSPTVTEKKSIHPEPVKEVAAPAVAAKSAPVTAPALVNPHLTLVCILLRTIKQYYHTTLCNFYSHSYAAKLRYFTAKEPSGGESSVCPCTTQDAGLAEEERTYCDQLED